VIISVVVYTVGVVRTGEALLPEEAKQFIADVHYFFKNLRSLRKDSVALSSIPKQLRDVRIRNAILECRLYQDRLKRDTTNFPNILLIINDSLSGHYLGFNSEAGAMTPQLDRFAAECVNFRNAIAQCPHTNGSIPSLLTGLYPYQHCMHVSPSLTGWGWDEYPFLSPDIPTLQEILRSQGYFTVAFVGRNITNFYRSLRGIHYVESSKDDTGDYAISSFMSLLGTSIPKPYFAIIHIYDPHAPYKPQVEPAYPSKLKEQLENFSHEQKAAVRKGAPSGNLAVARMRRLLYIRDIEELDRRYGKLFNYLRRCPEKMFDWKRDIIIFTADHGEEFEHENGFFQHGHTVFSETIRVPLLLRIPEFKPKVIEEYVENASIFPTVLQFLGLADPRPRDLKKPMSVLNVARTASSENRRWYVLSEDVAMDHIHVPGAHEMKSLIRSDGYKLIFDTLTKKARLFCLPKDPKEEHDLSDDPDKQNLVADMKKELASRTNLDADFPVVPGKYLGHSVPDEEMLRLFGPPTTLVERFGKNRSRR
jgi:arylsulfatase A-like enzyme